LISNQGKDGNAAPECRKTNAWKGIISRCVKPVEKNVSKTSTSSIPLWNQNQGKNGLKKTLRFQLVALLWFWAMVTQHLVAQKASFRTSMFITCS
jgi:hypothetical protein